MSRERHIPETVWIPIARHHDLPLREGRVVVLGDQEIAMFNLGAQVLAVENRCPHRGGPLADGIITGSTIVCPLHAWKFSLESGKGANALSAERCVETFHTRIENGIVSLEFPLHPGRKQTMPGACIENARNSHWNGPAVGD
jgi:nitrite reductase (NADH) small subunit